MRLLPLALVLVSCASSQKAPPVGSTPGEDVTLTFDWPRELSLATRYERRKVRDGAVLEQGTVSYLQRSVPGDGTERRIVVSDLTVAAGAHPALALMATLPVPILVIDDAGGALRVEALDPLLDRLVAEADEARQPALRRMMATPIESGMRDEWSTLVGYWRGRTYAAGVTEEDDGSGQVSIAGETIRLNRQTTLEARVPCNEADGERRCVKLRLVSEPATEELPRLATALLRQLIETVDEKGAPSVRIERASMRSTVELVTEPYTLVPHSLSRTQVTEMTLSMPGEPATTTALTEENLYRYERAP